jgi:hypothetical protein
MKGGDAGDLYRLAVEPESSFFLYCIVQTPAYDRAADRASLRTAGGRCWADESFHSDTNTPAHWVSQSGAAMPWLSIAVLIVRAHLDFLVLGVYIGLCTGWRFAKSGKCSPGDSTTSRR